MPTHIDDIIRRMGYAESSCFKYSRDGFGDATLSAHHKKVLAELTPYAVYFIDNAPFVLFYEESTNLEIQKVINKKIWNAQIPLTIICGRGIVTVYNSYTIDREKSSFEAVATVLYDQIDDNSPFSYWEITNQSFWANHASQFDGEKLNDHLLRNLTDITKKIHEEYQVDFATKLILRLIFVRYLIDRGVDLDYKGFTSDVTSSRESLLKLFAEKAELYKLFSHLKNKFNGNLFELGNEIDDSCLTADVLQVLSDFFAANIDTQTGQISFFSLYDFNIIPVELISNIYEILLGEESRNKDNAFYTPHYLVDYILDGSVSRFVRDNSICKVLDPSCGSGVFLVESYRRMVEKKLNGDMYTEDDELLQNILSDNIYGVDLNEDAIDVAIFSLYLAVLDYKNPRTLKKFKLPNLKDNNLFVADFFDEAALRSLEKIPFDFIIGNPPWGSKTGLHVNYCNRNGYAHLLQNNDTCRSFVLRSKDFCIANMQCQCCFVLHSKMLYMQRKPSKRFRAYLLENTRISRIIELSSVRKLVFKNADAPAIVLMYSYAEEPPKKQPLDNKFEFISMKPNLFFKLFDIIVVEKNDIKCVRQRLLAENDWMWKTLVYGLSGDLDALARLKSDYSTLGENIASQSPPIIEGAGVQYNENAWIDARHLLGRPLLKSRGAIRPFVLHENFEAFAKEKIRRVSIEALFHAPYCLVMKGMNTRDYTMRAVYSEKDFVFRDTVWALKGTSDQRDVLLNITGLLNSRAYAYFSLMLGSSVGIEREQRLQDEILGFPYVYRDDIASQVKVIQDMLKHEDFSVTQDASDEIEKLNEIIFNAYNLADNSFVDYSLNIQIPQLTDTINCEAFRAVNNQQLSDYAALFYNTLSSIYGLSSKFVTANIYPHVAKYYSAIEIVLHNEKPSYEIRVAEDSNTAQIALTQFSAHRVNDMFFELKDVIYFEENSFYIIKPNYYKNWHPAIAKLDLADVVDQILSRNGGNA